MDSIQTIARTYLLALGYSIFPIAPRSKQPDAELLLVRGYTKQGNPNAGGWKSLQTKHPVEGDIDAWFTNPHENVAIVTGEISKIVVLDVDGPEGIASLSEMDALPPTPTAKSASGTHYYFRYPGFEVRNFVSKKPGLDFRGDGGYVLAPPSRHPEGPLYNWEVSPFDIEPAELPGWLIDMLTEKPAFESNASPALVSTPYGRAALEAELLRLGAVEEGGRNAALNKAAFALGSLVEGGELSEALVKHRLQEVATQIGLQVGEIGPTINSGLEGGRQHPRTAPIPYTEQGNAARFASENGMKIKYIADMGKWFAWDGRHWILDDSLEVSRLGKQTVKNLQRNAPAFESEEQTKERLKWWLKSQSSNALEAMLRLGRSEPNVVLSSNELDRDEWLFNVLNGTVNLKNGMLYEHRREDYITKQAPVLYRAEADAPLWTAFIDRIFGGDAELINYVQKAVGYTLTGLTTEQVLFFLFGSGKNGKTTFIETLRTIMGDYAKKAQAEMLMVKDRPSAASNDIARLKGARLVVPSEVEEDKRLAEATIKDLTGGDTIVARFLHHEFFEFQPSHKLWMYGNHKPVIRGTDAGIWRRIRLIPFKVEIPENERDPYLLRRLIAEGSGIFNWALQGLYDWRDHGLRPPEIVLRETEHYRQDMDSFGSFLTDYVDIDPLATAPAANLFHKYLSWAEAQGINRPMTQQAFGRKITERGFEKQRMTSGFQYIGLKVRDTAQP